MVAWIPWAFVTLGVQGSQQCYRCRRYVSIRILFYPLAAEAQRTSLAGPSPLLHPSGLQRATLTEMFLSWSAAGAEIGGERQKLRPQPPECDSAVVPCLHGCLAFLKRHSPLWIFSLPPPLAISPQSATVHPEIALQCPCSNSQRPHDSVDLHPCPGYIGLWH